MSLNATQEKLKQEIYERIAQTASALASPARLLVLQLLAHAPRSVEDISTTTGFSFANVSQHLKRLLQAGLVACEKRGNQRIYSIASPEIAGFFDQLVTLTDGLDARQRAREHKLTAQDQLGAPDTAHQIREKVRNKQAILLDVRTQSEHRHTPVDGAIPVELEHLKEEASQLNRSRPIYVICRGPYCTLATQAVRWLRAKGFQAFRLRQSAHRFGR